MHLVRLLKAWDGMLLAIDRISFQLGYLLASFWYGTWYTMKALFVHQWTDSDTVCDSRSTKLVGKAKKCFKLFRNRILKILPMRCYTVPFGRRGDG